MKNRISENPGRVLITPENGSTPFYATMTRADNPTQEGDPLCKDTLLKDATAALFGLGTDAVPDDVLVLIKQLITAANENADSKAKIETGTYIGTGSGGVSLTFSSKPKVIFVGTEAQTSGSPSSGMLINNSSAGFCFWGTGGSMQYLDTTWGENSVSWSNGNPNYSLNTADATYNYYAIL